VNDLAQPIGRFHTALGDLLAVVCPGWEPPDASNAWALAHPTEHGVTVRRWRLGEALAANPLLARQYPAELVAAIVLDHDVSLNRQLVEPLIVATSHERVLNLLLAHAEPADLVRQTGAVMAWYWASMPIGIPCPFPYAQTPRTSEIEVATAADDRSARPLDVLPPLLDHRGGCGDGLLESSRDMATVRGSNSWQCFARGIALGRSGLVPPATRHTQVQMSTPSPLVTTRRGKS
jgi:hypothetical protein